MGSVFGITAEHRLAMAEDQFINGSLVLGRLLLSRRSGENGFLTPVQCKGPTGDRGPKGDTGPMGREGARGPKGDQGPPGSLPTYPKVYATRVSTSMVANVVKTVPVTFPSGRFTSAPAVSVSLQGTVPGSNQELSWGVNIITATGCNVYLIANVSGPIAIYVTAMEML